MKTNEVITTWQGAQRFTSTNPSGEELVMSGLASGEGDPEMDKGLSPKALMLSSLAGCSGIDVAALIKKMRLDVEDFKIVTTGALTEEVPTWYHSVRFEFHFYGKNLNEEKLRRAVELSTEKHCGVMAMFRQFAEVDVVVAFHHD